MTYKIVPGPTAVKFDNNNLVLATNQFESIINEQASMGWKYHSMHTVTAIQEAKGCQYMALLGIGHAQLRREVSIYMIIFCKEDEK